MFYDRRKPGVRSALSPGARWFCRVVAVGSLGMASAGAAEEKGPDYIRDIRPLLASHCFQCHGQDEGSRKANLRLDERDGALKGGKTGEPAIVPHHPEKSALIERITSTDEEEIMPPVSRKHALAPAQIELLRAWVGAGAEYGEHWAFRSPRRLPPPGRGNPIDAFVRARLAREGLKPAPTASADQLCRRLHLDLTGLPPTLAELDRFNTAYRRDPEGAVNQAVDALLASPHYGEKWARHWLDAARYADSDGYEKDLPRQQWAWRDWVISAINRDLPYDEFVIEQLAGDQLPGATEAQRIATGFLRNGMINEEGAVVNEQFRIEGVQDRIDTIGKSVLGLTLQCAQCHSHKFDPIKHTEYYGLFAALNNTYELNRPGVFPGAEGADRTVGDAGRHAGTAGQIRRAGLATPGGNVGGGTTPGHDSLDRDGTKGFRLGRWFGPPGSAARWQCHFARLPRAQR